jgi:cytoskeletal protein CcmA (bactofilin family)
MVDDDARIAGGNITINGTINHDLIVAGGQVTVSKNAKISGDLFIAGGMLTVDGQVAGKLIASGGTLEISGKIGKGVERADVGKLTISSGAEINGDLNYSSTNKAVIASDAIIKGKVNYTELKQTPKTASRTGMPVGIPLGILGATYIGNNIISFLSMFVLGIILILAIPVVFNRFNSRMKKSLGICVGWGAVLLFGVPVMLVILWLIAVVLFITLIGIGLGIIVISSSVIVAILYTILILVSTIFISFLIGQLILSKSHLDYNKYGVKVLAYLIGLVIVIIIYAIPFIGWLARLAGILFGFGGLIMVMKDWIWGFKKS